MPNNKLIKIRPVSSGTSTPDAGIGAVQKLSIPINGLKDGAGIAIDASQNIYISDFSQHVIYKIRFGAKASQVLCGTYGVAGNADGAGLAAKFNKPTSMCVDNSGVLWVIDSGNSLIRKIDTNSNVYTVASITPTVANDQIGGIAVDGSGNIYYVDSTQ